MKGRKPTPTALKKIRGTDQPVRMNNEELKIERIEKLPPAPSWFSKLAKKIYRGKGQELINQGIMRTLDLDMFLLYCNEYATYIETSELISKIPHNKKLSEDGEKIYRRVRQQNQQAWERLKSISTEFGFTPSSRAALKVTPEKEQDPLEKFLLR